jgi:hypothetical protein
MEFSGFFEYRTFSKHIDIFNKVVLPGLCPLSMVVLNLIRFTINWACGCIAILHFAANLPLIF